MDRFEIKMYIFSFHFVVTVCSLSSLQVRQNGLMLLGLFLGIMWHQFDILLSHIDLDSQEPNQLLQLTPADIALTPPPHFFNPITHHSQTWFGQACMLTLFPRTEVKTETSRFSPHLPAWLNLCVSLAPWCFHTRHLRGKTECWWYCFSCKERSFVFHKYLQLQETCIPSQWTALFLVKSWYSMRLHSAFCHHSAITNHLWEYWIRMAQFSGIWLND